MANASVRPVLRLAIEQGSKRAFAVALDWPGWCRSGRNETEAVDRLVSYARRYGAVIARSGHCLPGELAPRVEEHLVGGSGTDFGAPVVPAADESRPTSAEDGAFLAGILEACWGAFDTVASSAPEALRKGPRGGGRDRSKIVAHVVEAERSYYARRLGVKHAPFAFDDLAKRDALRSDIVDVLRAPSDGGPVTDRGWSVRFAARFMAWHVLDHAWEIEDRSEAGAAADGSSKTNAP